jgi:hypothetical protein
MWVVVQDNDPISATKQWHGKEKVGEGKGN